MRKITKAIIPSAGLGTRFLPATKAMAKEMLPIVDKPAIQYVIEEAIASGIEDIIIVTGRNKRAIEDHFDYNVELESILQERKQYDLVTELNTISEMANIHYIRQKKAFGLGHAVWSARKFIGDEPFAVLLGDDIIRSSIPVMRQLITHYVYNQSPVIAIQKVPKEQANRYGIVTPKDSINFSHPYFQIEHMEEKPEKPDSNLAIVGRYILTPDIFRFLEDNTNADFLNEVQLTPALNKLNRIDPIFGYVFEGTRYDTGNKVGLIQATIDFALEREELRKEILSFMEGKIKKQT